MVVRVWRGKTRNVDADAYQEYLSSYDGYRKTRGYAGTLLLRKEAQEETEFVLISLWTSMDAIARYAGPDVEKANLHDFDKAVLTSADPKAVHFTLAHGDLPLLAEAGGEG
jgi:heme-degrading monooxygenase HmoA